MKKDRQFVILLAALLVLIFLSPGQPRQKRTHDPCPIILC